MICSGSLSKSVTKSGLAVSALPRCDDSSAHYTVLCSFEGVFISHMIDVLFCTIILLLPFCCRAEEYGPIMRFNAFHRVSLMVLSPEGVKVLCKSSDWYHPIHPPSHLSSYKMKGCCAVFGV